MKILILALVLISFQTHADEFACVPNKSGWAMVNKTTNNVMRTGSTDFSYKQDCEKSVSLANRKNSPRVVCSPYNGGVALTNYAGKNLSPREAVFHEVDYCLRAIESMHNDLLCIPNGEDLYILADLKIDKYVLQQNQYKLLSTCLAGTASASEQDNYICASHQSQNENRHYHIYDRTTGDKLTETSYGKISACLSDLRGN